MTATPTILCIHCRDHGVARCDATGCSRVRPGQPFDLKRDCRPCWVRLNPRLAATRPAASRDFTSCIHRGSPTGATRPCDECGSHDQPLPVLTCDVHVECTERRSKSEVKTCRGCTDRKSIGPAKTTRVHGLTQRAFNPSLTYHGGRLLLCYRNSLSGSNLFIVPLNDALQPADTPTLLRLSHPLCGGGQEDPRLFHHGSRLHVAFNGVQVQGGKTTVHVLFAAMDDALRVERVWEPRYAGRRAWEKSWAPFEADDGSLYSVYQPLYQGRHFVLRHIGDRAYPAAAEPWRPAWQGGDLRGGAAPVRVGGEFWAFFHGYSHALGYTLGLYTFDAVPPFKPLRYTPVPLLRDESTPAQRGPGELAAVYPCGAVPRPDGNSWLASYGLHNTHCEIAEFRSSDLEKAMVKA